MTVSSLHDEATAPALRAIERARHILDRIHSAGRDDILTAQLVPGMFDCGTQLRTVGIFALRATFPLIGRDWPREMMGNDFATGAEGLDQRLAMAAGQIEALSDADFDGAADRQIGHVAGDAELAQTGVDYLRLFALPNLWFHLTMGYAIARRERLEIGKADFDGWHAYASDFRFVD